MTAIERIRRIWTGSISRRLVLGICGLVMFVMTVFAYTTVQRQINFLEDQAARRAIALTETLAINSVNWALTNDIAGLAEVIASAKKYPNLNYIMVVSKGGRVIAHSDPKKVGAYLNDADTNAMLTGPPLPRVLSNSKVVLETVAPLMADGRVIAWARTSENRAGDEAIVHEITREGVLFGLAAILLGGLFVVTVTHSLTRGLNELVGVTRRVAAGDTSTRVALHRDDELGALGDAFDTMAAALAKTTGELRDNEREVRQLLANLPVAVLIHMPGGGINYVNEAARELLGIPRGEPRDGALFFPRWRFIREDATDLPMDETPAMRAFHTGHRVQGQVLGLVAHGDGEPLWLHANAYPDHGTRGLVRRVIVVFLDITDRKKAAELLHQRAEEFRALIENAPDPIIRYNRQGERIYVNPAMERLTNARAARLIGETSADTRALSRQQADMLEKTVRQVISSGQPRDGEFSFMDAEGRPRHMHVRLFPERDQKGEVATVLSIATDITPVIETQRQLCSLVDNLPDYVARFDPSGRPIYLGPMHDPSCASEDDYKTSPDVFAVVGEEAKGELIENIQRVIATGSQVVSELRIVTPGGARIMEARNIPELDHSGQVASVLCIIRDITERVELLESLRQLSAAVEQSPVPVFITDVDSTIRYVNPAFTANSGYTGDEVRGKTPKMLKSGNTGVETYIGLWTTIIRGQPWRGILENKRKDGSLYWVEAVITPVRDERGNTTQFVAIEQDITDRKLAEDRIDFLAHHDVLTGLPNRLLGRNRMEQAMRQTERHGGRAALLFLDLDGFKNVNDTLGHDAGDVLLKEVADRLLNSIRKSDCIARHGGDEFLIMLSEIHESADVLPMVRRFLERVTQPVSIGGRETGISVSIGIAVYPEHGRDWDTLLKNADTAMYTAKEAGRNTWRFFAGEAEAPTVKAAG